jgi:hypothetical protein
MRRAQAIEQLFGKFQFARISALFDNVIREGSQASRVLDLAGSSLSELAELSDKELGVSAASAMNKFRAAIERVKVALVPLGELFLEIATPFIDFATTVLKAFNNLPDGMKKIIGTVITVVGGLGPVLLMTFGLINNGIANMIKFFATVRLGYLKMTGQAKGIGDETQYMTQEQLEAAAAAASLDQAHAGLTQRFTAEKTAVDALRAAYEQAAAAGARFASLNPGMMKPGSVAAPMKMAKGGVVTVGGRGNKDTEPALLTPGEAVIPAAMVKKYQPLIEGMIAGNIPGYAKGVMLGMPKSSKTVSKGRDAAEEIYQMFLKSSYAGTPPTEYGHQISPTSGHSFPIFGLGGVYQKGNKQVFVKPVLDEKAALAEMRSTEISRRAHGLEAPQQRIVVIRDPMDTTRKRRFLALESDLDPKFINNQPMGLFNEEQYFRQLVASLLRVDKDLSGSNVFGNVVADAGPGGVFNRASGLREYEKNLPSMEDQALINLLGIRGGAKRAFAESTLGMMAGISPEQYRQRMVGEIQKVLPRLKETIASFKLTNPTEVGVYDDMIRRLEQGLGVDWSKFHAIHSAVKPAKPKAKTQAIPGYKNGVVSVPGPKGAGDVIAAMLSPGEAVIPAEMAKKYAPLIEGMVSDSIPGYKESNIDVVASKVRATKESYIEAGKRRNLSVGKGRDQLNSMFSGSGTEIFDQLSNAGVSVSQARRVMSTAIQEARKGQEAYDNFRTVLSQRITSDADEITGFVKSSKAMVDSLRTIIPSDSKNAAINNPKHFAHVGMGAKQTGQQVLDLETQGQAKLTEQQRKILQANRNQDVELKTAFGMQNFSGSVNKKLSGRGVNSTEFFDAVVNAGPEIFDSSVNAVGKSAKNLRAELDLLNAEFQQVIRSLPEGTQVVDDFAKAEKLRAKGAKAVSVDEIYGQADKNLAARGEAIRARQALKTSKETLGEIRKVPIGLESPNPKERMRQAKENVGLNNAALKSVADAESARGIDPTKLGMAYQEKYNAGKTAANTPQDDPFVVSQNKSKRASPHQDAAALGKQDQEAYNKGAEAAAKKIDTRKIRGASSDPDRQAFIDKRNQEATQATRDSANIAAGTSRAPRRVVREGDKEIREAEQAATNQNLQNTNKSLVSFTDKISRVSIGLSAMTGVLSMFGGEFSGIASAVSMASGAIFALISITDALRGTFIAAAVAKRAETVATAMNAGTNVAGVASLSTLFVKGKGIAGLFANLGTALKVGLRFLGPIGIALSALAIAAPFVIKAFEDSANRVNGLGAAANLTEEKLKFLAEKFNVTAKTINFAERFASAQATAGKSTEEKEQVVDLMINPEFQEKFKTEIAGIKDATKEQAELALQSLATQLRNSGFEQQAVDAIIAGIVGKAERTDLNLRFNSILIDNEQTAKAAIDLAAKSQKAFKENMEGITEASGQFNLLDLIPGGTQIKNINELNAELKELATASSVSKTALESITLAFEEGRISSEVYTGSLNDLFNNLSSAGPASLTLIQQLAKDLNLQDVTKGITNATDAALLLQASVSGVVLPDDFKAIQEANKSENKDNDTVLEKAKIARKNLTKEINKQTQAQEKNNIATSYDNAVSPIEEQIKALQEQIETYDSVATATGNTAIAAQIAADANLRAAYTAALAKDQLAGAIDGQGAAVKQLISDVQTLNSLTAQVDTKIKTSGGGGQKSPFQEAIDSLKEQQKEAKNSITAYAKLRSAGLGVAEASEIAGDSMLAAALASQQVGSRKWNELVAAIRAARAEEEAWLSSTPEG